MKNKPFVIDYQIQLNDISADAKLRSWVILNYLQDAASRHADQLGVGLKQLRNSDLSWVLSRIRFQMEDFPEYGDTLRIFTHPSGFSRIFAYRQFVLTSATTGKVFGTAGSAWLTLNPENFRPVSPGKNFTGLPQWEFEGDVFFQESTLDKLSPPSEELDMPVKEMVYSSQIDYNRHLNNAFYAMFTENWLGKMNDSLIRMKELQINFNQSTGFGQTLEYYGKLNEDNSFYVEGSQLESGKNAFQAYGICEKISLN